MITKGQRVHLMAELWPDAAEALGCGKDDRERRIDVLSEALGRRIESANDINGNKEFDKVKAALLAISQPANLKAQLRQTDQEAIRLRFSIQRHVEAYWRAIATDKFSHANLDDLSVDQLTQLRNTLHARASGAKRREKAAAVAEGNRPF